MNQVSYFLAQEFHPEPGPLKPPLWLQAIRKLTAIDRLGRAFRAAAERCSGHDVFEGLLSELNIHYHVDENDLAQIPAQGPVVVVANHPFGLPEGAILAAMLRRVRPDFRIMVNSLLSEIPAFQPGFVFVNPYGGKEAIRENYRPLRESLRWLDAGRMLVIFPSGAVARVNWKERAVKDPPWSPSVGRLIRLAKCPVVPVFFEGSNGAIFQLAGTLHRHLLTGSLPRQFLNKSGKRIALQVGRPVPSRSLVTFSSQQTIDYLRCRTFLLKSRAGSYQPPVALSVPRELLLKDVAGLGERNLALETEQFSVYHAEAGEIPNVLREIGRLRELTFRAVGEGTGQPSDLDRFDRDYRHIFLWSKGNQEVAGAYRLGATPDLLPARGISGLYTSTLFRFRRKFFERLGPAIELGRSFVRPEYQKGFTPLLLLWKGIGRYVSSRPECAVMFGAVSISDEYQPESREMLAAFLETQRAENLSGLVRARNPFRAHSATVREAREMRRFLHEVEELADPIADLEGDGKGVPILIKHYLKLGGRLLGLNVDRQFSNALDALIMVDLRQTPRPLLDRYLSPEGAARVLDFPVRA